MERRDIADPSRNYRSQPGVVRRKTGWGRARKVALWIALRALEERVALQHKLAERAKGQERNSSGKYFLAKARENTQHAQLLRKILEKL